MNVLTSITVLGFLIFFHEMGHFLAAILQGIYVDGFSIGFGPSIIQKKYKDITYSFRAFPLGGFVSFPDEEINNIDSVLVAERPKIMPHIKLMKKNISEILNIDENLIGIKATTNERLGPEGREEGISCHSVVLLEKK